MKPSIHSPFSTRLAAFAMAVTMALPALHMLAPSPAHAQAAKLLPIESFFEDPLLSGAQLSPDGRALAMRIGAKGQRVRLAVLDLQTLKASVVASFADDDVGPFQWASSQRLVLGLVGTPGLVAVDRDGSNYRQLVDPSGTIRQSNSGDARMQPWNTFLLRTLGDSDDVLVVSPQEISREKTDYIVLRRLDTRSGRAEDIDAPLHAVDWVADAKGRLRVVKTRLKNRIGIHLRDATGAWKQVLDFENLAAKTISPRFVGADGQIYVEAQFNGKAALFTMDPESGRLGDQPVAHNKDFDLQPEILVNGHKLLGLRYHIDAEVTQWLDADAQALQTRIDALLPNTANRIGLPQTGDSPFVLVESFSDQHPGLTQIYHRGTGKLTPVGSSRPAVQPRQMAQTDFVRYRARDGLEIPAYLTLPLGAEKKDLPLVVLVHGGPNVRGATWRWDAEVQFLASRGYAVLQPEFRGSTGFGARHFTAGWKQWGRAMQTDLADGARWAIAQGWANPKRICIAGPSYGGYAALMGLAQDPDLFRCAINWVGVTDLQMLYSVNWSDTNEETKRYGMPRLIGDPVADAEMLKAASPLYNAARIKAPLLMAYGGKDRRVPIVHGEKFRDAVQPHNSQVEWVVYPDEGHGWSKPETRLDFWGRVERFLARHNPP